MYNKAVAVWLRFAKSIAARCIRALGLPALIFYHRGFTGVVVQGAV